jgi:hypothetical protein
VIVIGAGIGDVTSSSMESSPTSAMSVLKLLGLRLTTLSRLRGTIQAIHRRGRDALKITSLSRRTDRLRIRPLFAGILRVLLRIRMGRLNILLRLLLRRECIDRVPASVVVLAPRAA